jgi:hypothetical protein
MITPTTISTTMTIGQTESLCVEGDDETVSGRCAARRFHSSASPEQLVMSSTPRDAAGKVVGVGRDDGVLDDPGATPRR